jgi:hypothetical protein
MPCTPAKLGGFASNPPQMFLPQSHKGTMPGGDRVVGPETPLPKLTSNAPSKVVTAPSQTQDTRSGSNIKTEAHTYLISGEDSNSSSMYMPSCGSQVSNHNPKSVAEFTLAMDNPSLTICIP